MKLIIGILASAALAAGACDRGRSNAQSTTPATATQTSGLAQPAPMTDPVYDPNAAGQGSAYAPYGTGQGSAQQPGYGTGGQPGYGSGSDPYGTGTGTDPGGQDPQGSGTDTDESSIGAPPSDGPTDMRPTSSPTPPSTQDNRTGGTRQN